MTRGARLLELVAVMDRLRSPGGCPWDAEQTHASLVEYLIEEAYETVEAIDAADDDAVREELGDVLLQVVFHARIGEESTPAWDIDDVAGGIIDKLVRRHPHVFGTGASDAEGPVMDATQVEARWHARKAQEKGRASVVDGIPEALPALLRAAKVANRTAGVAGLPALSAAHRAEAVIDDAGDADGLGDLLLAIVDRARARGIDAEASLRAATRRRIDVIRAAGA